MANKNDEKKIKIRFDFLKLEKKYIKKELRKTNNFAKTEDLKKLEADDTSENRLAYIKKHYSTQNKPAHIVREIKKIIG